jgi:MtN3 and saliva related transmembrane protein
MIDLLGFVAGICTTLSFLPQVVQVWRTRSVSDISLGMYSTFVFGVCLWLIYGIVSAQVALIATNVVTLALAGSVLAMKLFYRKPRTC